LYYTKKPPESYNSQGVYNYYLFIYCFEWAPFWFFKEGATLEATPKKVFEFECWNGDSRFTNKQTIIMDGDHELDARSKLVPLFDNISKGVELNPVEAYVEITASVGTRIKLDNYTKLEDISKRLVDIYLHDAQGDKEDLGATEYEIKVISCKYGNPL